MLNKLTPKERSFVREYKIDRDPVAAAERAGWAASSARGAAKRLMKLPHVAAAIAAHEQGLDEVATMSALDVMRHWVEIATADPNELISYRKGACRHCHGIDHGYQFRDAAEFDLLLRIRQSAKEEAKKLREDPDYDPTLDEAVLSDRGGFGYRRTRTPHPDCPNCEGLGVERIQVEDTSKVVGPARRLYAGVKQSKDGIQILMRDQDAALEKIARHLGMFTEKVELQVNGSLAERLERARAKLDGGK